MPNARSEINVAPVAIMVGKLSSAGLCWLSMKCLIGHKVTLSSIALPVLPQ